jgi:acetylornithine/N-succinyldiaminopimelate aminotransferase
MRPELNPTHDSLFAPTYGDRPLVLSHGQGVHVSDVNGKTYLDFAAGIAVSLLGHGDRHVAEAVCTQSMKLMHASNYYNSQPTISLATRLTELSGFPSVFFCNSGTEANEAALKFARAHHYRLQQNHKRVVICFERAFHGRTMGALSATHSQRYREPFMPLLEGFDFLPLNDVEALSQRFSTNDVGAVIIEPVQGEGGVRPCDPFFLQTIQNLCRERGALFILDEIQCSLGRMGQTFAFQKFGIQPDIVTLAKPLAGGLPMGAVLIGRTVRKTIEPGDHGTTFGGNPVCAAAACAVLEQLEAMDLPRRVRELEGDFAGHLESLSRDFPQALANPRGVGFLRGIDTTLPAKDWVAAAQNHGLLILAAGPNTLRFAPPLIATPNHFQVLAATLRIVHQQLH